MRLTQKELVQAYRGLFWPRRSTIVVAGDVTKDALVAKLAGREIAVRRARAGEKLEALDDKTYELLADDLVIADGGGAVALAGVMGGASSEITNATDVNVIALAA